MYQLLLKPYYDSVTQCYKQVISVSPEPRGKLLEICKQLAPTRLSSFRSFSHCDSRQKCFFAILNPDTTNELLRIEDLPLLLNYLVNNGYTVDKNMTKIMQKANTPIQGTLLFYIIDTNKY